MLVSEELDDPVSDDVGSLVTVGNAGVVGKKVFVGNIVFVSEKLKDPVSDDVGALVKVGKASGVGVGVVGKKVFVGSNVLNGNDCETLVEKVEFGGNVSVSVGREVVEAFDEKVGFIV